jgi:hypothetical protein
MTLGMLSFDDNTIIRDHFKAIILVLKKIMSVGKWDFLRSGKVEIS